MARNGTKSRLYRRDDRGGGYYGDLRAWSDVGGKREPLIPPGAKRATTDRVTAEKLLADRIAALEGARRTRAVLGLEQSLTLAEAAREHLIAKKKSGRMVDRWLQQVELHLRRACDFFGDDRLLDTIGVKDVRGWIYDLQTRPGRGGTLGAGVIRAHLHSLANLYRRAESEGSVPVGFNPVRSLMDKPIARPAETFFFEVDEMSLILAAAKRYRPPPQDTKQVPFAYELLATAALTGGRPAEVIGLAVADVSFDRSTITFRPHPWRRLKTLRSARSVPLWPQAREILQSYIFDRDEPLGEGPLFPHPTTGEMIGGNDYRKTADAIAASIDFDPHKVRLKYLRHTYCAARLQTLDRGAPVSPFTVARELGHGGTALVNRIYGHLGEVRHRSEVVEYRIEQHRDRLADRLHELGWGKG